MKPWTITCTFSCLLLLGTECLALTATTADLNALKAELEALKGAQGAGEPGGALPVYSNATAASKVFNTMIEVIGDFIGATGSNHVNPDPALQMHESEVAFQAIVDPYARADFFFSYGEVGVTLEEGYITFPAVPGGFLVKVGKQRAAFGKVNMRHNHVLPWISRPFFEEPLLVV